MGKSTRTGKGIPLSFMIANDQTRWPIQQWLEWLKNEGIILKTVVIDDCDAERGAIRAIFPSTVILTCIRHVRRAWTRNIQSKV